MTHSCWPWNEIVILMYLTNYFILSVDGRRYDKCETPEGRLGLCVVKRYCREKTIQPLVACDSDGNFCCPIPNQQETATPQPKTSTRQHFNIDSGSNKPTTEYSINYQTQIPARQYNKPEKDALPSIPPDYNNRRYEDDIYEIQPETYHNKPSYDSEPQTYEYNNRDRTRVRNPTNNDRPSVRNDDAHPKGKVKFEHSDSFGKNDEPQGFSTKQPRRILPQQPDNSRQRPKNPSARGYENPSLEEPKDQRRRRITPYEDDLKDAQNIPQPTRTILEKPTKDSPEDRTRLGFPNGRNNDEDRPKYPYDPAKDSKDERTRVTLPIGPNHSVRRPQSPRNLQPERTLIPTKDSRDDQTRDVLPNGPNRDRPRDSRRETPLHPSRSSNGERTRTVLPIAPNHSVNRAQKPKDLRTETSYDSNINSKVDNTRAVLPIEPSHDERRSQYPKDFNREISSTADLLPNKHRETDRNDRRMLGNSKPNPELPTISRYPSNDELEVQKLPSNPRRLNFNNDTRHEYPTDHHFFSGDTTQPRVPGCGVKPYDLFIAGGETSEAYEWPWMTSIFRRHQGSRPKTFLCGGSLINTKYVLTAAHCFVNNYVILPASSFVIRLGSHYLDSGEEYTVADLIVHHNHSGSDFFNDIALVKIASEVYITDKIAPICLPPPNMISENLVERLATVAGWGDTTYRTGASRALQHVTVPIVSSEECFAAYSRVRGAAFLARGSDHVICAGLREGGKDACLGDSGGPLMLKTIDDRWTIVGIVSLGYKCAEPGYPGVYTRVTHYLSWIQSNTKLH